MALTVGELLATITVDDAPAQAGMNRAESGMRATGDNMVADADRAGREAGAALGEGMADGAAAGGDQAADGASGALAAFGWAAVGAGIGAAVMAGVGQAMAEEKGNDLLAAQLGANPAQAKQLGKAAGSLYSKGYTDSVEEANEALKGLWQQGLVPADATSGELEKIGGRLSQVAQIMGEDVGPTSAAVGQMLKTGMAKNAEEAFDILVKGTQNGANKAEDLLDTFNEYGTQFRDMGVSGQQAMGLIQQGLSAGARDADIVADAFKELNIRIKSGEAGDALKSIGLNADQMAAAFTKGGPAANAALDTLMDRLRAVKDPTERSRLAVALLGTQSEDLAGALFALDPSTAVKALGDVEGAASKAGATMRDNAATRMTEFTRTLEHGAVAVIGGIVIPALTALGGFLVDVGGAFATAGAYVSQHSTAFTVAAGLITAFFLPTLVALAIQAGLTTTAVVTGWVAQGVAGARAVVSFVAANATILAGWIAQGAGAAAAAVRVVAAWVLMGAQSMIQAARMAAAWLIAMGPVGLIIAAVVALVALVVANWDTIVDATKTAWEWVWNKIKAVGQFLLDLFMNFTLVGIIIKHWDSIRTGTVRVWNAIVDWVKGLPQKLINFFLNWTLPGLIIKHWQSIKDGSVRKAIELVNWVKGLPGRIASGIGSLKDLLYDKGTDVVRGLLNGVKSMGSWLKGQLISFAKNMIPGPIAKALGIHSPSKVMAKRVGRWIPAGVVAGIRANTAVLDRTMANLVTPPPVPALAGATTGMGGGTYAFGQSSAPAVHIEHWHGGEQTPEENAHALAWRMKARG
ncbi:phage tail tape measure protein [Streptomyces sp. NPDC054861]